MTQKFDGATVDLLTSDRPLIIVPGLDAPTCVMELPLTPRLAFFATQSYEQAKKVGSIPASRLARALNNETVRLADRQIYAANALQANFVRRKFAPRPEPDETQATKL